MIWPPVSTIGWNPIDIDGIECLIGYVDSDEPWTILGHDCDIGVAKSYDEAIEMARKNLNETPWLRGPTPTGKGPDLPPPPPMAERKDPAVQYMTEEQYVLAVRAELISLLGCDDADKSVDQWGETYFNGYCHTARTPFSHSVAFCAYSWAENLVMYKNEPPAR